MVAMRSGSLTLLLLYVPGDGVAADGSAQYATSPSAYMCVVEYPA